MRVNTRYISSTRGVSGKRGTSHLVAHTHRLCDVFSNLSLSLSSVMFSPITHYVLTLFKAQFCINGETLIGVCADRTWRCGHLSALLSIDSSLLTLIAFHLVTPSHKTNRSLLPAFQSCFSHHHDLSTIQYTHTHARTHAHKRAQCFSSKTKPMFYRQICKTKSAIWYYVQFSTEYHKLNALIPTPIMREKNLKEKERKKKI